MLWQGWLSPSAGWQICTCTHKTSLGQAGLPQPFPGQPVELTLEACALELRYCSLAHSRMYTGAWAGEKVVMSSGESYHFPCLAPERNHGATVNVSPGTPRSQQLPAVLSTGILSAQCSRRSP